MDNIRLRQRRLQRDRPNGEQADHKAANTTMHQPNRCRNHDPTTNSHTQAGQHQTSRACKGRNGNGVPRVGDTMVRHARQ